MFSAAIIKPFNKTAAFDRIDHSKPRQRDNALVIVQEFVDAKDTAEIRHLQVIMLKLIKSGEYKLVMKTMELMAAKGAYARNFLVHVLMLEESFNTGRIGVRAFDEMDLALLQFLIGGLEIPMKPLQDISSILQIAIAVNDPLLLNYAIDVGADVNDNTLNIKPLANAIARGNKEVTDMLIGNGAKL